MDLHDTTHHLIERAARRGVDMGNAQRGFVQPGVSVAATRPGSFVDPTLDPDTGLPVEGDGAFLAGDVVGVKAVG